VVRGTEAETKECVEVGVEILTRALAGDMSWFEDSVLGGCFVSRELEQRECLGVAG